MRWAATWRSALRHGKDTHLAALLAILIGLTGSNYSLIASSSAASQGNTGYISVPPATGESQTRVVANELMIKLKPSAAAKVSAQPSASRTGSASLSRLNQSLQAQKFEPVIPRRLAGQADGPLAAWYKVELPGAKAVITPDSVAYGTLQQQLNRYRQDPDVETAEPNYLAGVTVAPNDPMYKDQYGPKKINMESAWEHTTGSHSVAVAVVDTGIDRNHVDLAGNIWANPGEVPDNGVDDDRNGYVDDYNGWDFVNNDNDPYDDYKVGHGTLVAGIIGAATNNATGIAGVNWQVKLAALKAIDSTGNGTADNIAKAISYGTAKGMDVTNLSIAAAGTAPLIIQDAIRNAYGNDVVLVAGAGNNNKDASGYWPANMDETIAVGATDAVDERWAYSNYGSKLEVMAPGVNVTTLCTLNRYCYTSGTSLSTPHAAGVAALMLAKKSSLTNREIRKIFHGTSQDLGAAGRDDWYGYGRIDANAAMLAAINGTYSENIPSAKPAYWRSGTFNLRNSLSSGPADNSFGFGNTSGDVPLMGDWDGNGTRTPGVYRTGDSTFYLRNSNSSGAADIVFQYGAAGDKPLTGDWDGNGTDTIGVVRGNVWYLRNSNTTGASDISFMYGKSSGDIFFTGDWDGNGTDTPGLFREAKGYFYLRNSNSGGAVDIAFIYGGLGDKPVAGDWNGDRIATVGLVRGNNWMLKNANAGGGSDMQFTYGASGDTFLVW
ncbi:S8 family serine peptidase [Candidatus Parcubacteria bacterium]|nr:S8 family serine peptidase [Candidatus Parcubacteria bacterium]